MLPSSAHGKARTYVFFFFFSFLSPIQMFLGGTASKTDLISLWCLLCNFQKLKGTKLLLK